MVNQSKQHQTATEVRAPMHPQVLAKHPKPVRGTTRKRPHTQIMLDSHTVLPKIPPGIPGTQFLGSQLQDSVTCVNDSHKRRPDPAAGTWPAPCEHGHQQPGHHLESSRNHRHFWSVVDIWDPSKGSLCWFLTSRSLTIWDFFKHLLQGSRGGFSYDTWGIWPL